jgi:hypothetical protein
MGKQVLMEGGKKVERSLWLTSVLAKEKKGIMNGGMEGDGEKEELVIYLVFNSVCSAMGALGFMSLLHFSSALKPYPAPNPSINKELKKGMPYESRKAAWKK